KPSKHSSKRNRPEPTIHSLPIILGKRKFGSGILLLLLHPLNVLSIGNHLAQINWKSFSNSADSINVPNEPMKR
ncbi:MAG: hypothetical protein MUC43_09730, partial [Pirellula sp.]|nr:hypothetical protein [Pirellula sp.]